MNSKKYLRIFLMLLFFVMIHMVSVNAAEDVTDITFDADYYAEMNGDLKEAGITTPAQLKEHYMNYGIKEGKQASLYFNVKFYLLANPDVAAAFGTDGYEAAYNHFITEGIKAGRLAVEGFDPQHYLATNTDVADFFGKDNYEMAYYHFVREGVKEGRITNKALCIPDYLAANSDLAEEFGKDYKAAYAHFMKSGIKEARILSGVYSTADYLTINSDVAKEYGDNYELAYIHFLTRGSVENRTAIKHTHSYSVEETAATCVTKGKKVYTCACGDTYTEETAIDPENHEAGEVIEAVAATCTKTGLSEGFACAACGVEVEQEEVEALGHEYDYTKPYATKTVATCIKEGEGYFKCTREGCDDAEGSRIAHAIPMVEHEYTIEKVVAPSCTQGYTEHFCKTTGCRASYKDNYVDAITEHQTLEAFITALHASDNTVNTVKDAIEKSKTGIRLVDENGKTVTKAPTKCSETCNIEYTCATCSEKIKVEDYQYIAHASGAEVEGSRVSASCTTEGYHKEICPKCNKEVKVKDANKKSHTGSSSAVAVAPTCTEGGYSHYTCTTCGEDVKVEGSETVAKGHTFVYATSTSVKNYDATENSRLTAATCLEAGYGYCTGCNKYMNVAALGHDMKLVKGTEPSCTSPSNGAKDYYQCVRPGCEDSAKYFYDELGKEEILDSNGQSATSGNIATIIAIPWKHTFDTTKPYTEATCTTAGSGYCTVCKKTVTEKARGHKYGTKEDGETYYKAATCKTKGYEICKVCGDNHELAIDPNAHDFDGGLYKTTTDVTCTSNGTQERVCALCDHVMTEAEFNARTSEDKETYPLSVTINATGHKITKQASYISDGYYFVCDNDSSHTVKAITTGEIYQDTADSSKTLRKLDANYKNANGKTVYYYIENGKPVLYELKGTEKTALSLSVSKVSRTDASDESTDLGKNYKNSTDCIDIEALEGTNTINITNKAELASTVNGIGKTTHGFAIVLDLGIAKANVQAVSGYAFQSSETSDTACNDWGASGANQFIVWLSEEDFEKGPITLTFKNRSDSSKANKSITVNYIG